MFFVGNEVFVVAEVWKRGCSEMVSDAYMFVFFYVCCYFCCVFLGHFGIMFVFVFSCSTIIFLSLKGLLWV